MSLFDFTVEQLCLPISEESPTGTDPRSDISPTSTYYLLKDVRNNARASERKALIDEESITSVAIEWQPILDQIPTTLIEECKDLEYTAWYVEALCRKFGFKGLAIGFELAKNLIELYWNDLYPIPDDGDMQGRIAPLIGLNGIDGPGALVAPIKSILITDGVEVFSTWQYEQACEIQRLDSDKQQKKISGGAVSLEQVEQSIKESTDTFYIELHQDVESALAAFLSLSEAMDKAMLGDPQPTSYVRKALESCLHAVKHIAKDILIENQPIEEEEQEDIPEEIGQEIKELPESVLQAQIETREQALRKLAELASFFRKTEPHSPMSYAIEQVVRWSELSLPELLQELIVDGDARNGFFKLSGIKTEDSSKK
jgi:type VI secretion system protein ImpA